MRFPDTVTVLRATSTDEYGNPAASWVSPLAHDEAAFVVPSGKALMPAGVDVRVGDRLVAPSVGKTYDVAEVRRVRSTTRGVLTVAALRVIDDV